MSDNQSNHQSGKIRVIACGMIAREILAINEQLGADLIDLKCLPADFHHHPEKIAPAMEIAIQTAREEGFENIFAGYADCGTKGELDKVCAANNIERIEGPHCFSFYLGNDNFKRESDDMVTTFFITDFLARHFENFMVKPLGLDRHPDLKEMYFGNYERALYIAQTDDPELDENARIAAAYLGLKYERRITGYGDLTSTMKAITVDI